MMDSPLETKTKFPNIVEKLEAIFKVTDLEKLSQFFGIQFDFRAIGILLLQSTYVKKNDKAVFMASP